MKKRNNQPNIRFKALDANWKTWKIGDVLTEKYRPILIEDEKQYQLVTVKRRNEGVVSRGYLKGKSILVKNYFEVEEGDFIISKRQIIHGASGIIPKYLHKAVVSNEYLVATSNENLSSEYLALISKLPDMYKQFFLSSFGVDVEKMVFDVRDWKKRTITLPDINEQDRITSFFKDLDELISIYQRKRNKLIDLRKSMHVKMFPQIDEYTPKIRFAGFNEVWEKKSLCDLCNIKKGVQINKIKLMKTGAYPVINGGITPSGYSNNWNTKENTITISEGGNSCGFVNFIETNFWSGGHCYTLEKLSENVYAQFLYQQLKAKQTKLMELRVGSGLPNIQRDAISNFSILLPKPKEQEKIGSYFKSLDSLINKKNVELDKLNKIKKGCYEKMISVSSNHKCKI